MKGGGGKKKKRGKNNTNTIIPLITPTESQYFARVVKNMGSCRFQLDVYFYTIDDKHNTIKFRMETKLGVVRGKMLRRNYVNAEDIVLVSDREFEKSKVDIIHVYKNYHWPRIQRHKFAPPELFNNKTEGGEVNFMNASDDDSDSESELDLSTSKYSINKFDANNKLANNKSNNYMADINLPSFSDEDQAECDDNSNIQYDEFGNEL